VKNKGFSLILYSEVIKNIKTEIKVFSPGRGFGLVVRAEGWHAGYPDSILGRDGLYTFGCITQRFESALVEILRYIKKLFFYLYLVS
jgi:hypothetical protein